MLSIDEILSAIERYHKRQTENDIVPTNDVERTFDKFWGIIKLTKNLCSKVQGQLCEYSMFYAAKSVDLEHEIVETIVSKWLRAFSATNERNKEKEDNDSAALDIEVEKYVSRGGKTTQIYEIADQLHSKVLICI